MCLEKGFEISISRVHSEIRRSYEVWSTFGPFRIQLSDTKSCLDEIKTAFAQPHNHKLKRHLILSLFCTEVLFINILSLRRSGSQCSVEKKKKSFNRAGN